MSVEYYMFLEEVRMISSNIDKLQQSLNKKALKSILFIEDLDSHLECFENLLNKGLKK